MSSTRAALARTQAVSPVFTATSGLRVVGSAHPRQGATWPSPCRRPVSNRGAGSFRRRELPAGARRRCSNRVAGATRRDLRHGRAEAGNPIGGQLRIVCNRTARRTTVRLDRRPPEMFGDPTLSASTKQRPPRLSRGEWRSVGGMTAAVVTLHVVGWGALLGVVAPAHYAVGGQVFGIGLGVTAYSLGMRHAF